MATEFGLLNEQREFLLCVDYNGDPCDQDVAWVRFRTTVGPHDAVRPRVLGAVHRPARAPAHDSLGQRHGQHDRHPS
ncbi:MAG TPA: hypothetical protein VMU95_32750 [Trebonia sp.]|nr:hypothetical protein [Trebonia sp.]